MAGESSTIALKGSTEEEQFNVEPSEIGEVKKETIYTSLMEI
jgi:hypothetical protein